MSSVELQASVSASDENWIDLPLFGGSILFKADVSADSQNVAAKTEKTAACKVHDSLINNLCEDTEDHNLIFPDISAAKNVVPLFLENVEPQIKQVADGADSVKAGSTKIPRKKKAQKKVKSQKRDVVAMKFFGTREEKMRLEAIAKNSLQGFSNFVRLHLGLHPNQPGRKKQSIQAAFDLHLDEHLPKKLQ